MCVSNRKDNRSSYKDSVICKTKTDIATKYNIN